MGSRKAEEKEGENVRSWEDEKVSRAQSAWGIGHRAEGRRRKSEGGGKINTEGWGEREMEGVGDGEEGGTKRGGGDGEMEC